MVTQQIFFQLKIIQMPRHFLPAKDIPSFKNHYNIDMKKTNHQSTVPFWLVWILTWLARSEGSSSWLVISVGSSSRKFIPQQHKLIHVEMNTKIHCQDRQTPLIQSLQIKREVLTFALSTKCLRKQQQNIQPIYIIILHYINSFSLTTFSYSK